MDDGLAVGGGVLVLGAVSLWVAGPPGMFACGLALVIAGTVGGSGRGAGETGRTPARKVSCPECGARNDHEEEHCHHCGTELRAADAQDRQ